MENSKKLIVKEFTFNTPTPDYQQIDSMFNMMDIPFNKIDIENWSGYEYHPQVEFRIAYSKDEIYLQYHVVESCIKAVYGEDAGSAPYKESCLEFFCIPHKNDPTYYNLELNCIGIGTFAGGAQRTERTRFTGEVLSQIRRHSTLGNKPFGTKVNEENPFEYTLTVAIPLKLYSLCEMEPLKGRTIRANFYKCGDEMPQKQYLSWNPIGTERPNFHTPQYFGELYFE
ncbi:MAG: hypothetical protein IKY70_01675 [Bacteroidales bacterium]|nr:hypothetical protein [Bacteroidales bacterium]